MKKAYIFFCVAIILHASNGMTQSHDIAVKAFELRMNGNPAAALKLLDSGLRLYPDTACLWFEKGRCLDWVKLEDCKRFLDVFSVLTPNLQECQYHFRKARRLEPDNARYHYWDASNTDIIALTCFYLPWKMPLIPVLLSNSVKHHKKAVQLDPENLKYRYDLVNMLHFGKLMAGDKALAQAHADTLYSMNPIYGIKAYDLIQTEKAPYDALPYFLEIEKSDPDNIMLLNEIASLYSRRAGEEKDTALRNSALTYFKRILELDPGNNRAIKMLYQRTPRDRKDEVIPYLLAYLQAVEPEYRYYSSIGLQIMGNYFRDLKAESKAKAFYSAAAHYNPNSNSTYLDDLAEP